MRWTLPLRRAIRWVTRSVYSSSSSIPARIVITIVAAAASSDTASARPRLEMCIAPGNASDATRSMAASTNRISRKLVIRVNGSRSAAITGGRMAFRMAIRAAMPRAPQNPETVTFGTTSAANSSESAEITQLTTTRSGRTCGRWGRHRRSDCEAALIGANPTRPQADDDGWP